MRKLLEARTSAWPARDAERLLAQNENLSLVSDDTIGAVRCGVSVILTVTDRLMNHLTCPNCTRSNRHSYYNSVDCIACCSLFRWSLVGHALWASWLKLRRLASSGNASLINCHYFSCCWWCWCCCCCCCCKMRIELLRWSTCRHNKTTYNELFDTRNGRQIQIVLT